MTDVDDASPDSVRARVGAFLDDHPVRTTPDRELREARYDAGLAFVHFDVGSGGLDLDASLQRVVDQEFLAAGAVDWGERNVIGLGMAAPAIHSHGSPAQRERLLRPLFTGEEVWCQLFAEPGAGSDIAAVTTTALAQGDDFLLSGRKSWTTLAHVARWGLVLARTDPAAGKHAGLTCFVLDLQAPGVDIRPVRQLTGEAEFDEVVLDAVRVPVTAALGPVGGGWAVARTTLIHNRLSIGAQVQGRGEGVIAQAVAAYRGAGDAGRADPALLDRLMRLWVRAEALRLTDARIDRSGATTLMPGPDPAVTPGPDGAIVKLEMAEVNQQVFELCLDLIGPNALLYPSYALTRPSYSSLRGDSEDLRYNYLRSLANSIEGGTSEIMRNFLGERVLGLPADPRPSAPSADPAAPSADPAALSADPAALSADPDAGPIPADG